MAKNEKTLKQLEEEFAQAQKALKDKKEELARKQAEEEERKQVELALVKDKRYKEILRKQEELKKLINGYIKDYGSIKLSGQTDDMWPMNFWNHFFI